MRPARRLARRNSRYSVVKSQDLALSASRSACCLFRPDEKCLLGQVARVRRVFRQTEGKAEERRIMRVHQLVEYLTGHVEMRGRRAGFIPNSFARSRSGQPPWRSLLAESGDPCLDFSRLANLQVQRHRPVEIPRPTAGPVKGEQLFGAGYCFRAAQPHLRRDLFRSRHQLVATPGRH